MKRFRAISPRIRNLGIAIVTVMTIIVTGLSLHSPDSSAINSSASVPAAFAPTFIASQPLPTFSTSPKPTPSVSPAPTVKPRTVKTLYGHLPYQEDDPARLVPIGKYVRDSSDRTELMDIEAAQAFKQMAAMAKSQGVLLMPISGFRTIADQKVLFARQIERRGSAKAAARLSAPPGHSEHHTGYAIDIADRQQPETDLKYSFQQTKAYRWLSANANQFGFEQSFPPNNWQGVSNEPWHWRYVLSARAAQVFAFAKGGDRVN